MGRIFRVVVGSFVVWSLLACSGGGTDAELVDNARAYIEEHKYSAAIIELKNALRQNKNNQQARMLLGTVYLETGNPLSAEKELRLASAGGVADDLAYPPLARALLARGSHDEVVALSLENLTANEPRALVLAAQGLAYLELDDTVRSELLITEAVSKGAGLAYPGFAMARLQVAKKQPDLARLELDRVFLLDGSYAPAWGLLGDIEARNEQLAQAEAAYTEAAQNSPDNFSYLMRRVMVRILQQDYAAAQEDLDVLKQRSPEHQSVNFYQGLNYIMGKRWPEAVESFEQTLSTNYRHQPAMYYLSLAHLGAGNGERAREYARQFLAEDPLSNPGRKLVVSIELANRQYEAAEEMARSIPDYEQDAEVLNLLASALTGQHRTDEVIEVLNRMAELQPDSADIQQRLGMVHVAAGRIDSGIVLFEKARGMDADPEITEQILIQLYLEQEQLEKARAVATSYLQRHPDKAPPNYLMGSVRLKLGEEQGAEQAFVKALEIAPGDPAASRSLAALAVKREDYGKARAYLEDVLLYRDSDLETLLNLAVLDGWEKDEDAKLQRLRQAVSTYPGDLRPRVQLARLYIASGEPDKVLALMSQLERGQLQRPEVLELTGLAYLALRQFADARATFRQLVGQQPESAQSHYFLAQAYAGLGNTRSVKKELETTVGLAPESYEARLALARLLLLEGESEAFIEQFDMLKERFAEHPEVIALRAMEARAQGDQELSARLLEEVFETAPTTNTMLAMARQKWTLGERAAAFRMQEDWAKVHPDDTTATLALAGAYLRQDQVDQAIGQYEQVLQKTEKNVLALNNLAWSLRDKDPEMAMEYAQRAFELAPDAAPIMDTLAVVLSVNGEHARAQRTIAKALKLEPDDLSIRYHSAMISAAAGDTAVAISELQNILGGDTDFYGKSDAEELLARLKAGQ